jgi:hypothetical protein
MATFLNYDHNKFTTLFLRTAAIILLATGLAKLISGLGSAHILDTTDPIFLISFRHLFWFVGSLELVIATFCFIAEHAAFKAAVVAWLSSCFLLYRFALFLIGYHKRCPCLGNFTDALAIPTHTVDTVLWCILGYLFVGSCMAILCICKGNREEPRIKPIF